MAVLPIAEDGSLLPLSQLLAVEGEPGPHRKEQPHPKPHFNPFDPSGRYVITPDKGADCIFSFAFEDGKLTLASTVASRETAGPRNIAFHPTKPVAYCVNELDSTVTTYAFNEETGELTPLQILPSLPQDYTGNSRASGIVVGAQGQFVYASNRGYDSVAVFRIRPEDGCLVFLGAEPCQGKTPRFITLSPDGRHLYALNEDSDTIVVFAVDARDGGLRATGHSVACGSPVCMVFVGA